MKVELLVVPDCPNERPAAALLRTALDDVGLPNANFTTTVVGTVPEAERRAFTGSPTFLIDGADPFAEPGRPPGLACRVYLHGSALSGLPDIRQLRQALKRAATAGA